MNDNQSEPNGAWTRTRTKVTKDGLEAEKVYDYPETCYPRTATTFPRAELLKME